MNAKASERLKSRSGMIPTDNDEHDNDDDEYWRYSIQRNWGRHTNEMQEEDKKRETQCRRIINVYRERETGREGNQH